MVDTAGIYGTNYHNVLLRMSYIIENINVLRLFTP